MMGSGRWRWIVPGALVAALALSGSTMAAPTGQITEFPTASPGSLPEGMAPGPDGNLWFAEFGKSSVANVDPSTGAVTEFPTPTGSSAPLGIGLGPDGNMWFTEAGASKVGEINPTTRAITEFPTPTSASGPVAITAGPDGNIWFTESAANQIAEINPTTHVISEFPVPTLNSLPFGIAAGPDGSIWFTEKNANNIAVINPTTHLVTEFPVPSAASQPNAITPGPGGTLWFTEQAGNKVTLLNPVTHSMTETPTPVGSPLVIVPGADGTMWFTEGASPGAVASINPITRAITSFATPTAGSAPIGVAPGSDGNVWFGENFVANVARVATGAPGPVQSAPVVIGSPQAGQTLTCQAASFSAWAGQLPGFDFGFDGFRWLLDGNLIGGAGAQTLALPTNDAGHQISCEEIATYPLLTTTVPTTSVPVTVSPSLSASLVATSTTPSTVSLTITCQGLPTQTCSGRALLTSRVTTRGSQILAVAAKRKPKPKPPKKVTKVQTVASGSYSIATGKTATVRLSLNPTGRKLLTARYKVPATLTLTGTASAKKTVTFKYGVLHLSPSYTWAFAKKYSYAIELSISRLPRGSKVTLSCHGDGCPFSTKTFAAPKNGRLALASALKKRHLQPGTRVQIQIAARNEVSEIVVFTIVSGKSPKESFLCLPPGARKPSACVS